MDGVCKRPRLQTGRTASCNPAVHASCHRRRVPASEPACVRRVSKVVVAAAAVLSFGCGESPTGPAQGVPCPAVDPTRTRAVHVEIPEVYELANIVLALTNYQQLAPHSVLASPYLDEVLTHFSRHRTHPLITGLNSRLTAAGSWNYDAYYGFRENSYAYSFEGSRLVRRSPQRPWGGNDVFTAEVAQVEDFAAKSGFREFFAAHRNLYDAQIQRYPGVVRMDRMWLWLETAFPARYDTYRVVFSPLIYGSHSTYRPSGRRETVMFIAGPDILPDTTSESTRTAQLERLVFTEIDHNYVNPVSDLYSGRVARILSDLRAWNRDPQNYGSSSATFNEYMTWAVFNLYASDAYDAATFRTQREALIRNMVNARGFPKFREFEQIVMDIYLEAGPGACVSELYPQILDSLERLR